MILDMGKGVESILATTEQSPLEHYRIGQNVKAYVLEVRRTPRGPALFVSRTHKGFLKRLFELEVPEIHNGTVEIRAIAREAGSRSKVAVSSRQEGLDPVGATVGQRGARVQAVVAELGGEKIDVIPWNDDPAAFVANALSPAQVISVEIDQEHRIANVTVPERMLSLAIGREGQNARLAARLTGWRIDIRSDVSVAEAKAAAAKDDDAVEAPSADGARDRGDRRRRRARGADDATAAARRSRSAPAAREDEAVATRPSRGRRSEAPQSREEGRRRGRSPPRPTPAADEAPIADAPVAEAAAEPEPEAAAEDADKEPVRRRGGRCRTRQANAGRRPPPARWRRRRGGGDARPASRPDSNLRPLPVQQGQARAAARRAHARRGEIAYDPTGKANGRGAYVCHDEACITGATGKGGLARALDATVPLSLADELRRAISRGTSDGQE